MPKSTFQGSRRTGELLLMIGGLIDAAIRTFTKPECLYLAEKLRQLASYIENPCPPDPASNATNAA